MTRHQEFDPQAIPNFNAGGRVGELDPDEPEERQSSVQSEAGAEELAGPRTAPEGSALDDDDAGSGGMRPHPSPATPVTSAGAARTPRDDRARGVPHQSHDHPDPVSEPPGGIDGLVGAP